MRTTSNWAIAALLTIAVGAIAANTDAKSRGPAAPERSKVVPAGVCPAGHSAMWINSSTLECLRELP
ncbi:MAG: hypothetical protein RSD57_19690 [Comamonas sp.]